MMLPAKLRSYQLATFLMVVVVSTTCIPVNAAKKIGQLTTNNLTVENRLSLPGVPDAGAGVTMYINLATGKVGVSPSSRIFKNSIKSINGLSSKIMQLRPVSFLYNNDPAQVKQYGLIAEEVAEVFPELVIYGKDNKPFSIAYNSLVSILLQTIQGHQQKIEEAQKAATEAETTNKSLISALNERLETLEQKIAELEKKS